LGFRRTENTTIFSERKPIGVGWKIGGQREKRYSARNTIVKPVEAKRREHKSLRGLEGWQERKERALEGSFLKRNLRMRS